MTVRRKGILAVFKLSGNQYTALQAALTFDYKSRKSERGFKNHSELSLTGIKINGEEYNNTASSLVTISLCTIVDVNIEVSNQSGELCCECCVVL